MKSKIKIILKNLEDIKDHYAWKGIDFEEAGKDEKMQEMADKYDEIDTIVDMVHDFNI